MKVCSIWSKFVPSVEFVFPPTGSVFPSGSIQQRGDLTDEHHAELFDVEIERRLHHDNNVHDNQHGGQSQSSSLQPIIQVYMIQNVSSSFNDTDSNLVLDLTMTEKRF
ncbi:hypothetical protein Btru_006485 [Bulinus truncatus]|nr:hypothetical protein Btru_006485 [Bulinus truncatus]